MFTLNPALPFPPPSHGGCTCCSAFPAGTPYSFPHTHQPAGNFGWKSNPGRATVRLAWRGVSHSKEKTLCEAQFAALLSRNKGVLVCGRQTLAVNCRIPPSRLEAVAPLSARWGSLQTCWAIFPAFSDYFSSLAPIHSAVGWLDLTLTVYFLVIAILGQMPFRHWSSSSNNLLYSSRPWISVKLTSEKPSHLQLDAGSVCFVLASFFSIIFLVLFCQ